LGLLSFPSIFERLGVVGGVIATIGLAGLAYLTCWIMVDFKLKHMGVMNYGDAMGVVFGKYGRIFVGTGVVLKVSGIFSPLNGPLNSDPPC
jgi:amino acid permease